MPAKALALVVVAPFIIALNGTLYALSKKWAPNFAIMAVSMFSLATVSLVASLCVERKFAWGDPENIKPFGLLILAGAINAVSFWCIVKSYEYVPVWKQQIFIPLQPVFAALIAYFVSGQPLTPRLLAGAVLVMTGIYVAVGK